LFGVCNSLYLNHAAKLQKKAIDYIDYQRKNMFNTKIFVPLRQTRRYSRSCVPMVASGKPSVEISKNIWYFAHLFVPLQPK